MLKRDLETVVTNLKGGLSEKKLTSAEKRKKEDIVKPKNKKLSFFKKLKILLWGN
jgi:hypothetical protein